MADARLLHEIPLYRLVGSDNWVKIPVLSTGDGSFKVETGRSVLHFKDDSIKPNAEGKYIINIEQLDLGSCCGDTKPPREFEMPSALLESRKERRQLNALEENTIYVDRSVEPIRYFYLESDKLRILHGESR